VREVLRVRLNEAALHPPRRYLVALLGRDPRPMRESTGSDG
jgi:hypothetical protein